MMIDGEEMDEIQRVSRALDNVFRETSDFIVIGLTGRTGSGCSTAAQILTGATLSLPEAGTSHYVDNEKRKFKIVKKYIDKKWRPFKWLQIRSVITRYIITLNFAEFTKLVATIVNVEFPRVWDHLLSFRSEYERMHEEVKLHLTAAENTEAAQDEKKLRACKLYLEDLPVFSNKLRDTLQSISKDAYTRVYQTVGDNIRSSGTPHGSKFDPEKVFIFSRTINKIIKSIRYACLKREEPCYVVIDAIRNPYEAIYLKERYADFHLLSVNTSDENRLAHLRKSHKFSDQQIVELDRKEYPEKLTGHHRYTSQNIQKCIEISDIHINNPRVDQYGNSELRCQLAWYVTLMLHPGLITPTSIESGMQIAYSVKQNSGCISRQVGAVVTDASFSVKGVGWNSSPQGQVPCLLRSAEDLLNGDDSAAFSQYERNNEDFRGVLKSKFFELARDEKLDGRSLAFCFKDAQNEVEREKNQVHTRSLHAEENAFLQISKYGGAALQGGVLFTTASPCELCAKKAYQLGLSRIVYIDPYPGIATSHVLSTGDKSPRLELFRGAVGRAFHRLYQPMMPFKDELDMLLSIPKTENKKDNRIKALENENYHLKAELEKLQEEIRRR